MKYRSEIDGLRSVAVLPVILFHAGLDLFSGGFVGVDIFFVISGYLITTIIVERLDGPGFSIVDFYARRARRILPALALIVAVTTPFAWIWMLPSEFKDYSQSVAAVSLFASNFLFWIESGYFAAAAEAKPLLHTWSLAVEEQYYLFFPLLLMLFWRRSWRLSVALLVVILVLSLAASEVLWRRAPDANFYLLPSRAWELMAGSLCAIWVLRNGTGSNGVLAGAGLLSLIVSIFLFDESTPFPSLYALLPVAGTALILVFSRGTAVARLLSMRIPVGIGLISYSAYLWHQPLLALARVRDPLPPPLWVMVALGLLSLPLAWLSWRFVEQPARHRKMAAWKVVAGAGAGSLIVCALGAWLSVSSLQADYFRAHIAPMNHGLLARITEMSRISHGPVADPGPCRFYAEDDFSDPVRKRFEDCAAQYGGALVIFGDSHSLDVYNGLIHAMDYPFIVGFGQGPCRPAMAESACEGSPLARFLTEEARHIALGLYAQAGFWLFTDAEGHARARALFDAGEIDVRLNLPAIERATAGLAALRGEVPVVWLGPRLEPHVPPDTLLKIDCDRAPEALRLPAAQERAFADLDAYLAEAVPRAGLGYLSEQGLIGLDPGRDIFDCDGLYWSDSDHWSPQGEDRFGRRIAPAIDAALRERLGGRN